MDEMRFEDIGYGSHILEYPKDLSFSENVKYASAEFNKLHTRKVRLPDGKGNVIYLLTNTFDSAIRMINSNHFIIPPSYTKIFYPQFSAGSFMGKRYKVNTGKLKKDRDVVIKSKTRLKPYPTKKLQKSIENILFSTSDIYETFKPIMDRYSIKRCYEEFMSNFVDVLTKLTPEVTQQKDDPNWNNRLIIIDADSFSFKKDAKLNDNKTNPLYLIYLAFLRNRDLSNMNVDIDMMICSKNMFLKFNPAKTTMKTWSVFRQGLFRIINANLDDYTEKLSEEEKNELAETANDKIVTNIVKDATDPYTKNVSASTKAVVNNAVENKLRKQVAVVVAQDQEIKKTIGDEEPKPDLFKQSLQKQSAGSSLINRNPISNPLDKKHEKLFKNIAGYQSLGSDTGQYIDDDDEDFDYPYEDEDEEGVEEFEDGIKTDAQDLLINDADIAEEILDEIQDKVVPLKNDKNSPVNSARDKKLREEQKKVVVQNETIEQILERDTSNVKIQEEDKSSVMHTTNQNMHKIRFANFDKTYIDEIYMRDIVKCFDMLKDQESPFYITNIDIKDTSTTLDFKDTWTVSLKDELGKKHTIRVDIPKFQNDRFMLINGTRFMILKQNFYNPLVKDTPDTVILTTNYNKITIQRRSTKSLGTIERIFSLIKKSGDSDMFMTGDSSKGNMKYISSLEYDELSRRLFRFKSDNCLLCFSRDYIKDNMEDQIPSDIKGNEFFIGMEGKTPVLIDEDTGLDRTGRTIVDIIEANLPDQYKKIFDSIKGPKQSMFVEGKLAGEFIPIISTLIVWIGLTKALDKMNITWRFDPNAKRVPQSTSSKRYIRFADGVLEYEAKTYAELILNGLAKMKPEQFKFEDFNSEVGYDDFIYSQWGSYNGITELKNFKEFLIDPITKRVCQDMMLPDDPAGLLIRAVQLLSDNAYTSKASDKSYRTRSVEIIAAILYSCLATQYRAYVKSGLRIPMTLNQRCVISKLIAEKTVEPYSTLNPVTEVSKTHTISTKGYKGSNSEHSYDEEKRSYDPSAIGKLAIQTSPDKNVGINRVLVVEPTISNVRGYREPVDDIEELKDVNIFSPVEMLTPATARVEDPIRVSIGGKQSGHVVPVANASPSLVSNGFDEALQFHLSDDFVVNAEEDGKIIEINEEVGFMVVQYKSGKNKAINIKPEVVKNSGGGFYISNKLRPTKTKVGETFKKDEPLAYHDKYFQYSKINGLRYAIGPLAKIAFMSTYNTYEDAGICTESLAERMKTSVVYQELGKFKKNNNIISMVEVGDHVNIGDVLIKFDVSVEDNELAKYLSKLSDDNAALLEEETKNDIKTMHAGKVIAIKVYTLLAPEQLSESLGRVVKKYFDKSTTKKEFLEKYDQTPGIMKAGYLLTDSTEPVKSRYNSIKGIKGIDVLIEIYIEHDDVMGVGDKIALYSANKQIVSEVIPKGWEPYSEFRPEEEISAFSSPGTIARRMTPGSLSVSACMKCLIELKRKIKSEIKYR